MDSVAHQAIEALKTGDFMSLGEKYAHLFGVEEGRVAETRAALDNLLDGIEKDPVFVCRDEQRLFGDRFVDLLKTGEEFLGEGMLPFPSGRFVVEFRNGAQTAVCFVRRLEDGIHDRPDFFDGFTMTFATKNSDGVWAAFCTLGGGLAATRDDGLHFYESVSEYDGGTEVALVEGAHQLTDADAKREGRKILKATSRRILALLAAMTSPSVEQEIEAAPAKLNRKRASKGRQPIPERRFVRLKITPKAGSRGGGAGGGHASPRPHWRRGHVRTYADGRKSAVRPTVVNVAPEERERMKEEMESKPYLVT